MGGSNPAVYHAARMEGRQNAALCLTEHDPQRPAAKIEKLEAGHQDHAIAISLVAKDVQGLAKAVKRQFKRLKAPRRRKPHIGFYTEDK
jgi:hypothetical protein